jgi:hypothetical protein
MCIITKQGCELTCTILLCYMCSMLPRANPEGVSQREYIAIHEQFGRIYGLDSHLLRLKTYSPQRGYVRLESTHTPVNESSEAFVLRKTPRVVIERGLKFDDLGDENSIWEAMLTKRTPTTTTNLTFNYNVDTPHDGMQLPTDASIHYDIAVPDDYYSGPTFAHIKLGENLRPTSVTLPLANTEGLLAHANDSRDWGRYIAVWNDVAYLELDKEAIHISTIEGDTRRPQSDKGSFSYGELFRLPDTHHGYKINHQNGIWTFEQYGLSETFPQLVRKVGIRDLSAYEVSAALKGNERTWSTLPDRLLIPAVNT